MRFNLGHTHDYPVAANTTVRVGAIVTVNAGGFAVEGSAATGQRILGIATQHAVNNTATNGAASVSVLKQGIVDATLASGSGLTQASIGNPVYLDGYDASNQRPVIHGTATGRTLLGTLVSLSGTTAFIKLETV